jgi:hypothetical protein
VDPSATLTAQEQAIADAVAYKLATQTHAEIQRAKVEGLVLGIGLFLVSLAIKRR